MTDARDDVLAAAFRAAFCAALPRGVLPENGDEREAFMMGAAKEAARRVTHDLVQLGGRLDEFPVAKAHGFVEEVLSGARAVPAIGKIAANSVYAGLIASIPGERS